MKVKVIKTFRDKKTKIIHNPGDELEVSKKRYADLMTAGGGPYAEEIPVNIPGGTDEPDGTDEFSDDDE